MFEKASQHAEGIVPIHTASFEGVFRSGNFSTSDGLQEIAIVLSSIDAFSSGSRRGFVL